MKYNREELLRVLEAVSPGLAIKEAIEQSSCFVFLQGEVATFNDEVACVMPMTSFTDEEIAVPAKPLMDLLRKLAENEIDIELIANELVIKGKKRRAGITCEAEVALPIGSVDRPEVWNALDPEFTDAVGVVQQCASRDQNQFHLTCIHLTPEYIEACDNFQMVRYPIPMEIEESCLVKRDSLKHVMGLGMIEVSETGTWMHFRNGAGLVLSVRREILDYEDLTAILEVTGDKTTLPGGLAEAVEKAEVFSAENSENNVVFIELRKGKLRIRGVGVSGWYEERKDVKWMGEPLSFSIAPNLLVEITNRTNDCYITPGRLMVDGGKFTYVTCLGKVE